MPILVFSVRRKRTASRTILVAGGSHFTTVLVAGGSDRPRRFFLPARDHKQVSVPGDQPRDIGDLFLCALLSDMTKAKAQARERRLGGGAEQEAEDLDMDFEEF
jgi:hypothetical protein